MKANSAGKPHVEGFSNVFNGDSSNLPKPVGKINGNCTACRAMTSTRSFSG
jgi:hypothetical protein